MYGCVELTGPLLGVLVTRAKTISDNVVVSCLYSTSFFFLFCLAVNVFLDNDKVKFSTSWICLKVLLLSGLTSSLKSLTSSLKLSVSMLLSSSVTKGQHLLYFTM